MERTRTACSGNRSISSWIMLASAKSLRTQACQRSASNTRRRQLSAYLEGLAKYGALASIWLSKPKVLTQIIY
ncbi:hypothetical protein CBM2610_P200003 [Cupriavidus taiwanensis]|nr:hypothetical protein CBM2610_P200003 [Cupriavidus taiwanensis]